MKRIFNEVFDRVEKISYLMATVRYPGFKVYREKHKIGSRCGRHNTVMGLTPPIDVFLYMQRLCGNRGVTTYITPFDDPTMGWVAETILFRTLCGLGVPLKISVKETNSRT